MVAGGKIAIMPFFKVSAKCGHVGKGNFILIDFAVNCETKKEAAERARFFPRVKHDHRDAIVCVEEINREEFEQILETNENDPYLRCGSKHEQNSLDLSNRIQHETPEEEIRFEHHDREENRWYKLKKMSLKLKLSYE
jgi:hypothetical protein